MYLEVLKDMSTSRIPDLTRTLALTVALVGLLILPGCGIFSPDETTDGGGGGQVEYADPTTPDLLITNFQKAWANRDFVAYDKMRHEDFLFEFAAADIAASGTPNGVWTKPVDDASVSNMFNNVPGKDTAAVQSISLTLTPQSAVWAEATEPELLDSLKKTYAVEMTVVLTDLNQFQVTGYQDFYAVDVSENPEKPHFQMVYWRDQGILVTKTELAAR